MMNEFDKVRELEELDKETQKLVMRYAVTYTAILKLLERQINQGLNEREAQKIMREIESKLKGLNNQALKYSKEILPQYYYLSLIKLDKVAVKLQGVNVIEGANHAIHKRALNIAVNDLYGDLAKNTRYMRLEAKKIIRANTQQLLTSMIESGESYNKTKNKLKDQLVRGGVSSFVDAGRKNWKIDRYADMVTRTKSRMLHNEGTMNRLEEYRERYSDNENFDLIQISSHGAEDWCSFYEGKVFSISGKSNKYPSIETLPNRPYNTLHPNCKHVFLPYMPALRGEGETVDNKYQNLSVKELNKIDYETRKK